MAWFMSFLIQLAIGIGLQVLGYLLMGRPKANKPDTVQDLENPTAEAGRPIPVVFGEMEVTGVNIVWYGEKSTLTYNTKA